MPNPKPITDVPRDSHEKIGSLQKEAFIVVVVVVVGSVLLVCLSGLAFLWWHRRQRYHQNRHLVISPEDLKIIHLPVRRWDGVSYESGKAIYRNALVSLDPLTEVRLLSWDTGWTGGNISRRGIRACDMIEDTPMDAFIEGFNETNEEWQFAKAAPPDIQEDIEPFFLYPPSETLAQSLPASTPKAAHVTLRSQDAMDLGAPGQHTEDCHSPQGNGGDVEQGTAFVVPSWATSLVSAKSMPASSAQEPLSTVMSVPASSAQVPLGTAISMPASSAQVAFGPSKGVPTSSAQEPTGTVNTTMTLTKSQVLKLLWRSKHLQHPNIVPVIGVVWCLPPLAPSIPVLVRECEELGPLTEVKENMTMGLDAVRQADICKDTAQALAYLHAQDNPRLKPVLQPNLSSVMLNRYSRAKVCVPLPSLEDVLTSKGVGISCCGKPKEDLNPAMKKPDSDDSDECVRDNLLAPVHDEELEDVLRFGQGLAYMLTILPDTSTCDRSTSETTSRLTRSRSQGIIKGTSLFESQFKEIQAGYGQGLADLVAQCCATEKHDRPSFVQIHSRLEELTPEIIQVATQAHQEKALTKPPSFAKKATVDELLYELFPSQVADALKSGRHPDPEPYSEVSLFFSDVCGYTNICSSLQPHDVMNMLHRLYSRFDTLAQELCLFKVETVGDAYLCVANLKHPQPEVHARLMAEFAFGCLEAANNELICPSKPELGHIHIRVGIHAGCVMGAVVGTLNRRFGLFGDAVNVASRMESSCIKDHIQCSAPFMKLLRKQWPENAALAVPQGAKEIKGKGKMHTYMLYPAGRVEQAGAVKLPSNLQQQQQQQQQLAHASTRKSMEGNAIVQ
ncbi:hypothetical protein DUNSADRAFT_17922 [Dunaliella salina]|uniref:Guanylate cyclase domain-containing protein n=1 Tax=Dunaliella salina TaxID=3046 RepID=A0ABQ7H910_DUNSA|nr:hypothetical protein DUNSADRAFT_17922 [Dunaliella salina]|eukprot:KAF5843344.1 hypothetical protein DUNSADRAFT_17922 [Dunaliella salina]